MITGFLASLWPVRDQITIAGRNYVAIDVTQDSEARDYIMSLGYLAAPVVYISPDEHWSGFRPDRLASVA